MAGQFSPRKRAQQQKLFDKKAERAEVKKYMSRAEEYDATNLRYARAILAKDKVKYPFFLCYARAVIERLGTDEEKAHIQTLKTS